MNLYETRGKIRQVLVLLI